MTVTVAEQRGVRLRASADQSSSYTAVYHLEGSNNLSTIASTLTAAIAATYVDPINLITMYQSLIEIRELHEELWEATVEWVDKERYDSRAKLDVGSKRISFSTQGGTAHITTSLETVKAYYPDIAAQGPDADGNCWNKKAIGLTTEGDVQGVDIIVPAFKFEIQYRKANGTVTNAYAKTVRDLTGTVNDDTFYGFDAGEVLFLGADIEQEIQGDPTGTFHFLQMNNITGLTIGDIASIAKKGHEYLWVMFEHDVITDDDSKKWRIPKPKRVFVERVYDEGDLSALGIGTS